MSSRKTLVFYKNKTCCRFTKLHSLVLKKYAATLLENYLESDAGFGEIHSITEHGYTPLMLVVINMGSLVVNPYNKYWLVDLLLINGANIDDYDPSGNSLLMLAIQYSTFNNEDDLLDFVQYLLSQYADTLVSNYYKKTVIDICYDKGYEKIMKYILGYNRLLSKIKI